MLGERALNPLVLRISVAFLAGVLALLATSLYISERYVELERRLFIAGDLQGAYEAVRTAGRLDPFDPEPLQGKSYILQQQDRNEEAVAALRAAVERDPNNYLPYLLMANLQARELNDLDAAEESYRKVLDLNPHAYSARTALASLLLRKGELEEAKTQYVRLREQREISYEGLYDLGRIYVRTGEPREGYKAINTARRQASVGTARLVKPLRVERQRLLASMNLALADALVVQGRYDRARQVLTRTSSEQAPALLQLLDTDPEAYREQVLNSDIY
ncbi:MAG: tetratricopeptide repeat protein [Actinomycetota bacterium]|nr:tetratricopeptide repeat protein [Actinomycetota bacterium]